MAESRARRNPWMVMRCEGSGWSRPLLDASAQSSASWSQRARPASSYLRKRVCVGRAWGGHGKGVGRARGGRGRGRAVAATDPTRTEMVCSNVSCVSDESDEPLVR